MNEINLISLYIAFELIIIRLENYYDFTHSFSYFAVIFSFGLIFFCMSLLLILLLIEYGLMISEKSNFNKDLVIL